MSIDHSFQHIGSFTSLIEPPHTRGLLNSLISLARIGGKLPVSQALSENFREFTRSERARIEEVPHQLCQDILMPLRAIMLLNSGAYRRGKAILDLSVLGNRFGVTGAADRLVDLGTIAPMTSAFRGRALAAAAYQSTIVSALLAQQLYNHLEDERFPSTLSYLLVCLYELPLLLLAYQKPSLYAACLLDSCHSESVRIERTFRKVFPRSLGETASEIALELGLPQELVDFSDMLSMAPWNRRSWSIPSDSRNVSVVTASYLGQKVGAEISRLSDSQEFSRVLRSFNGKGALTKALLEQMMANVSSRSLKAVKSSGLPVLRLPEYLDSYEEQEVDEGQVTEQKVVYPPSSERIDPCMLELKACLQAVPLAGEFPRLPQALLVTFMALIRALDFDRASLFVVKGESSRTLNREHTFGRAVDENIFKSLAISDLDNFDPLKRSINDRKAVFQGDPVFDDDWPFVSFPVIQEGVVKAVFYADRKKNKNAEGLSIAEQLACTALAEVWHSVPKHFF